MSVARRSLFLVLVGLCVSAVSLAGDITFSNSVGVTTSPSLGIYTDNYALSNSIQSNGLYFDSSSNASFSLSLPGLSLPVGSVIDSATLTLNFPETSTSGGYYTSYISPVDATYTYSCGFFSTCTGYYSYSAPQFNVTGYEYGTFSSVTSGAQSVGVGGSGGTYNLLAMGFGPELLAGNPLSIGGTGTGYIGLGYTYTGYNAYSDSVGYAYPGGNAYATLDVTYSADTPEPNTLAMMLGFLGLAAVILRRELTFSNFARW